MCVAIQLRPCEPHHHVCTSRHANAVVGLFLFPGCYLRVLEQFDEFMQTPLSSAVAQSRYGRHEYPVVAWRDVEVHFPHAASVSEAIDAFERRRRRFLASDAPIVVKLDSHDGLDEELLARFLATPFRRKIAIVGSRHRHLAGGGNVLVLDDENVPDGRVLECAIAVEDVLGCLAYFTPRLGSDAAQESPRGLQPQRVGGER